MSIRSVKYYYKGFNARNHKGIYKQLYSNYSSNLVARAIA